MSESYEWGDPLLGQASTKFKEWYKATRGIRDIIRIVGSCDKIYVIDIFENGKFAGRYPSAKAHGDCPIIDHFKNHSGFSLKERWATVVLHISKKSLDGGDYTTVGKVLAWRFADEIKEDIREIHELTNGNLGKTDIAVRIAPGNPENEKFQKLKLTKLDTNVFDSLPDASKNAMAKDVQDNLERLKALYNPTPEQAAKIVASLDDDVSFNTDSFSKKDEGIEIPEMEAFDFGADASKGDDTISVQKEEVEQEGSEDPLAGLVPDNQ